MFCLGGENGMKWNGRKEFKGKYWRQKGRFDKNDEWEQILYDEIWEYDGYNGEWSIPF